LQAASIVRAPNPAAVIEVFMAQDLEVAAGVKQQLQADARRVPGLRLLDGRFMAIRQAVTTPKSRPLSVQHYLNDFVEELKATGFIADCLCRHGIEGVGIAPAGYGAE
jgi:polar amino acid transport system substrate-binding protein